VDAVVPSLAWWRQVTGVGGCGGTIPSLVETGDGREWMRWYHP